MSQDFAEYTPVKVHITGSDINPGPEKRRCEVRHAPRTITLTAANPTFPIAGNDPLRKYILFTYVQNNIVMSANQSQAADPANTTDATLANPVGVILANVNGAPGWTIEGQNEIWVSGPAFPTKVSFMIVREI